MGSLPMYARNTQALDSLYDVLEKLDSHSNDADLKAAGAYFAPSATAYLWSMREAPAVGPQGVADGLKNILTESRLVKRQVVSKSAVDDGSKVILELKSTLDVLGTPLEQPETVIATFNEDGLITDFKVYSCWSHIVMIKQKISGEGPYKPEALSIDGHGCP